MTKKAQLEAFDAAVAPDLPTTEPEPVQPEIELPEPETVAAAEPEAADEPASDGEPEGELAPEPGQEPEGELKPEGEPEGEVAAEPEKQTEPVVEPETPKRPSDEFGELPKDAKQETRERFEQMRGRYDELHEKHEAAVERMNAMVDVVTRTGASGEQFDGMLQYLGAVNSNNPALLEQAYAIAKTEFEELSRKLGKAVPGLVDPLADQSDLLAAVESGEISQKHAEELAAARTTRKLHEGFTANQTEAQRQQQALSEGYQAIASLGERMRSGNPAKYNANIGALTSIARLVEQSGLSPRDWAAVIEREYNNLPDIPAPSAAKPRVPAPIRPGGVTGAPGGSAAHKEPGNAMEALDMALNI